MSDWRPISSVPPNERILIYATWRVAGEIGTVYFVTTAIRQKIWRGVMAEYVWKILDGMPERLGVEIVPMAWREYPQPPNF